MRSRAEAQSKRTQAERPADPEWFELNQQTRQTLAEWHRPSGRADERPQCRADLAGQSDGRAPLSRGRLRVAQIRAGGIRLLCVWWLVWLWYSGLLGWSSWLPLSWYRTLVCPWLYFWVSFDYFIPVGAVRLHYRHTAQLRFVSDESTESTTAHPAGGVSVATTLVSTSRTTKCSWWAARTAGERVV